MSSKPINRPLPAVRFSRVMSLRWVVALGASVSVGLGLFILPGQLVQVAGRQTLDTPALLLVAIAIPFILTYAERGAVIAGEGGAYNLIKTNGFVWLTYAGGWLLLGGYIILTTLFGWGAALHLNVLSVHYFNVSLDLSSLAVALIGIVALNSLLGTSWGWQTKSVYIYVIIGFMSLLIAPNFFETGPAESTPFYLRSTNRMLSVAALMVSSLWGLPFILNARDEIRRPTQTILRAMLLTVALVGGLTFLLGWTLARTGVVPQTLTLLLEFIDEDVLFSQDLLITLYALAGLFVSLLALNQSLVGNLHLIEAMRLDGFLLKTPQVTSGQYNISLTALVLIVLAGGLAATQISLLTALGLASLSFLGVTVLVHAPDAFRTKPRLPDNRSPKLPFHPLFPWLTVALGGFMMFNLSLEVWWRGGIWIAIGALFYGLYARQGGLTVRRREMVVGETADLHLEAASDYVVAVGTANPKTAPALIRMGAKIARARNASLLVLRVLVLAEQMPSRAKQQAAQAEWEALAVLIRRLGLEEASVKPVVRLAPNRVTGILEAVREEGVKLLILGWAGERPPDEITLEPVIDSIMRRASCDVAVLRGTLPDPIKRVLVPTAGGPHAPVALALGRDLTAAADRHILVETLAADQLTPEREVEAQANLQATLEAVKNGAAVEGRVIEVNAVKEGLLTEAKKADLLLIGASKQGLFEKSFFGGLAVDIAVAAAGPAILVRGREISEEAWLPQLWDRATNALPTLTVERQAEVYANMRQAAQPSVDFFVLITLAAVIASLGLLQNSAAVIIGAMLVAPLMSPILAMAMSMVQGNLQLLRTAAEATTKGIVLAIGVGGGVVLISPLQTPTSEILARAAPNLLDLMVALASGAAAGYALSRKEVAAALPGVAIAAALVPPLCVVGYGIGVSDLSIAGGALLLFVTNLIAIVLAAALIFLALGFHPERAEREELIRGLKVTIASLGVVFIILALATAATLIQLNRQLRVERILNNEVTARASQIEEMTIRQGRAGFLIEARIINNPENQLSPAEVTTIWEALTEAVGGPVQLDATIIDGWLRTYTSEFDRERRLEDLFTGKMVERAAQVETIIVDSQAGSFTIEATIISFDAEQPTQEEMAAIQADLADTMEAPVSIRATILPARQLHVEAPNPPTPTPGP